MPTEYGIHVPQSSFDGGDDHGGDSLVKYVGGKRQGVMHSPAVHYDHGKMPRGKSRGRKGVSKNPMMMTGGVMGMKM